MRQQHLTWVILAVAPVLASANDVASIKDERTEPMGILPVPSDTPIKQKSDTSAVDIDETALKDNPLLTHHILESALKNKQWELVGELLTIYAHQEHDALLYHIARAGYHRHQREYQTSFAHYEQILKLQPALHIFRVDYLSALMENKRLADAQTQLDLLKQSPLTNTHAQLFERLQQRLSDEQDWQHHASANFEKTDNVNGASAERYLQVGDKRFEKSPESLPQKATGLSYDIGTQKSTNITGNHYWTRSGNISGVAYWDNADFNELTTTLKTGYQYQNHQSGIKIEPFVDFMWFDDKAYRRQIGISGSLWHRLSPKWQMSAGASRSYHDYVRQATASGHNGRQDNAHATLFWAVKPQTLLYVGADVGQKDAKNATESYDKYGVRVGVQMTHGTLPSFRTNIRFGKRTHDAPHGFFGINRQDDEWQLSSVLWHQKWQYKGYMPMLNYHYTKIDSNIDALYSRENQSWFVSVQKSF